MKKEQGEPCRERTEVYARVCGFFRPVQQWNLGKKEEYRERTPFKVEAVLESPPEGEGK